MKLMAVCGENLRPLRSDMFAARFLVLLACCATVPAASAQLHTSAPSNAIRVTVSQNNDGSQTSYQTDPLSKTATAITTSAGKVISKINYKLDDQSRYESGEVFGPGEKFQFRTKYKYDPGGRVAEETRLTRDNAVQMKLVYSYDGAGKPAGYSVFDAAGNLLGKTKAAALEMPPPSGAARIGTGAPKKSASRAADLQLAPAAKDG
jgi:YD repeat-containing protein